jgi:hypothetical protein
MGKSMVELGKINRNRKMFEEGIDALEQAAEELLVWGVKTEVIDIFEYLCSNLQYNISSEEKKKCEGEAVDEGSKTLKTEQYL